LKGKVFNNKDMPFNKINTISIQFLKEVKQDDNVIIKFSDVGNSKIFFEAIIKNTDTHCFRAELECE
jgi:acyl-CoA thioesterase FadM